MNVKTIRAAHFVGIGGINMSAVAKLLLAAGVRVSGSDAVENEQTRILSEREAAVTIGQRAENVPTECDVVIYTSAAPETNPERVEAMRRNIPQMNNFEFLGEWFKEKTVVLVCGTHGKSTTTAILGLMFEQAGRDPTVIVGSKVPGFPDGNVRIGSSPGVIIEGDEYAKHFLEFAPSAVLLTNVEHDHPDVFPTVESMEDAFVELIARMQPKGLLVANVDSAGVRRVLEKAASVIEQAQLQVVRFGMHSPDVRYSVSLTDVSGSRSFIVQTEGDWWLIALKLPGMHNVMNAAGAAILGMRYDIDRTEAGTAIAQFPGIWRRFELLGEKNGVSVYSDYGHHPTAVAATLAAAKEAFPDQRVILCFQPHHRNRTKHLFLDFVPSFDLADALVLCEIYDVKGRDAKADETVSSKDLMDAIVRHDADRGVKREVEYAANPETAVSRALSVAKNGDIVIVMGAGDIDDEIRKQFA